jgi:hypothetical protein
MMTIMADLLHKAYEHIEAGNVQYARAILESLINTDPMNIEAWEACMQISETCEELDYYCEQVLQIPELNPTDRESILDYYYFLRQILRANNTRESAPKMVTYEMVNQFTFNLKDPQSGNSKDIVNSVDFEQGLAWLLDKAIIVLHIVLLITGLKLINLENNFGYWIIMVLFISVFVNLWNIILPIADTDQMPDSNQLEATDRYHG